MPVTKEVGRPGPKNDVIGGVPTLHYLDLKSRGRGQVIRLFWEEAEIAYKDVRYSLEEFPEFKKTKLGDMNPTETVPVVELNNIILTQSYAILRHYARLLDAYDGDLLSEKYWVDAMCDIAIDWRTLFALAFFSPDSETRYPEHKAGNRARFLKALNTHLRRGEHAQGGPFVLGKKITYADLVIYQICHDEQLTQDGKGGLREYRRLVQLLDAVETRPNIARFMTSDRYLG
ncbi:hypothetical protein K402DRAFT_395413 [Aulographum hederae CBS 113979]|uniref:Glutathione S-transferase n=1 Tax=Aulographum hederae CBS 113979 TaxID=1176131 RepID=A0A6G1GUT1_9PEZI|nr:hypothetical protein K402DRAFT_395413 [Aulographum hederae CBS 113979]